MDHREDHTHTPPTIELSEAQLAYQMALEELDQAVRTHTPERPEPAVLDPASLSWVHLFLRMLLALPLALVNILWAVLREIGEELGGFLRDLKGRMVVFSHRGPAVIGGAEQTFRNEMRQLLLEVLWARDHVQDAIETPEGASYASKKKTLGFVMDNEARLQRLGQQALVLADMDPGSLRDAQPTAPDPARWWWFVNRPRAKRARRLSTLWFVLSLVPALASVVLVTLLAQRLAINGPDLLSGASVIAQVGLGLASIIAGRELLNDLILRAPQASWHGQLTFALASLFLTVVLIFYFFAPPAAAVIYSVFGQRAIDEGNAAEAELYLESAARLDPDPHAAALLEVGCLYETLGAPDRARRVFERVLEADSRLLLARYHLAELYIDRGDTGQALQLLEDGLSLLDRAREEMAEGNPNYVPDVDTVLEANQMEYLLRLARGRAYVEGDAPEQAKTNLRDAEELYNVLLEDADLRSVAVDRQSLSCGPSEDRRPYIVGTELNLHYFLALTYDALCDDDATVQAAQEEWRLVRNGRPVSSRQEAWRDEAVTRLSSGETCQTNYGMAAATLGLTGIPSTLK